MRRKSIAGVSTKLLSKIYAEAAAWLEDSPEADPGTAICAAASWRSFKTYSVASLAYRNAWGAWLGDDEGVLTLCFASAMAATGDLELGR